MSVQLTSGFAASVYDGSVDPDTARPTLQVLSVKKINQGAGGQDRYRIILSDGDYFCQAMVATQLNPMIVDESLAKHTVVNLTSFVSNAVQGRRLIIVLGLDIVPYSGDRIGSPANIESAANQAEAKPAPAAAAAPQAVRGNQAPRAQAARQGAPAAAPVFPIEALSPYSNKWTIKARVAQKSDIKHYSNQKGDGKLFNVTFIDESGEIRATGFNESVDNLYELLQEGKVYFVSQARVNIAKKQFSNVKNDYEIMFDRATEVSECEDNTVPQVKFEFKHIEELSNVQKDEMCDVIGIVREVHELGSITSKASNKPFSKRDIQLVDQTGWAVRLTLWGKQAESFQAEDFPVIAFKGVKVGDFGGRSLSMFSSATMTVAPDINEAHALRGWWDSEGQSMNFQSYSNSSVARAEGASGPAGGMRLDELKTLGQVKDEGLGTNDKVDYFTASAVVSFVKHETFSYPACANPDGCNKKVTQEGQDQWRCEKCDRIWDAPIHRYILSVNIMDHTGSIWATAFNDTAETLLGIPANDLHKLQEAGDDHKFQSYFQNVSSKTFAFQMMAKQDNYGDQPRVRYNCRKISAPDYTAESKYLSQQIEQLAF